VAGTLDERGIACVEAPDPTVREDAERPPGEKDVVANLGDGIAVGRPAVEREVEALRIPDGARSSDLRLRAAALGRLAFPIRGVEQVVGLLARTGNLGEEGERMAEGAEHGTDQGAPL